MGTQIHLSDTGAPLRWPRECAQCGAKDERLVGVPVGIAREKTHLKDLALQRLVFESATLTYPVCERHAGGVRLASWLTRKSPLPALLRGVAWVFGPLALLTGAMAVGLGVLRLLGRVPAPAGVSPDLPLFFVAWSVLAAALLIGVLWARRHVPLRLVRFKDDGLTLRFSSAAYARRFVRANPDVARSAESDCLDRTRNVSRC
ncbi:hypothetical protein FVQ98_04475 [Ottowia sp. GY511]|uniref:Uncharacterized protein n=1 Tax=Ottowia flava TaxID=2675430 RepID=A0ABW4L0P1_9BURK|nr:hypothetical protein [Ottowia sp. GY511]TXK31242.1 hypothetical protein FVQ98_04475 [Ottowia sp. GY511]